MEHSPEMPLQVLKLLTYSENISIDRIIYTITRNIKEVPDTQHDPMFVVG
jgi:hypothetical protein